MKQSPPKRSWKPKAPQPPVSPQQKNNTPTKKPANETSQQFKLDKNVLETLVSEIEEFIYPKTNKSYCT